MKRFAIIAMLLSLTTLASAQSIYVDPLNGNDLWDGSSPIYIGSTLGPKETISAAQDIALYEDEIVLADGIYYIGNIPITTHKIKSANGPENCTMLLTNNDNLSYATFNIASSDVVAKNFIIEGITVNGQEYHSRVIDIDYDETLTVRNCIFEGFGYMDSYFIEVSRSSTLNLEDCSFTDSYFKQTRISDNSNLFIDGCTLKNAFQITSTNSEVTIENSTISSIATKFIDATASDIKVYDSEIKHCKPINPNYDYAQTVFNLKDVSNIYLENCEFFNNRSLISCSTQVNIHFNKCKIDANEKILQSDFEGSVKIENSTISNSGTNDSNYILESPYKLEIKNSIIKNSFQFARASNGITLTDSQFIENSPQYNRNFFINSRDTLNIDRCIFKANNNYDNLIRSWNFLHISDSQFLNNQSLENFMQSENGANLEHVLLGGNSGNIILHGNSTIKFCTFSNQYNSDIEVQSSDISNCIFKSDHINFLSEDATMNYCFSTQSYDGGIGNLHFAYPGFADEDNNDYHLLSEAGRYDSAAGEWVRDDVTSPCIDAGDPASDFLGEPIGCGGRVNMGVYGNTAQASLTNRCSSQLMGDINKDCNVNLTDVSYLINDWLETTIIQD